MVGRRERRAGDEDEQRRRRMKRRERTGKRIRRVQVEIIETPTPDR